MQHPGQLWRQPGAPEALGEVGGHGGFGERVQCQLHTLAVLPELSEDRPQRMALVSGLHGAIGAENQQVGGIGTPRHRGEPGQRGAITPVQIFHHEYQGARGRERLQCVGEFAQHAQRGGRAQRALECLPRGGRQQRWQLA